jgi:hypothetical protein
MKNFEEIPKERQMRTQSVRYAAGAQSILAAIAVIAGAATDNLNWLLAAVCTGLLLAAFWTWFLLPNSISALLRQEAERERKESLRMLSHYRHDVMNHVQLLKGYLQLQKFDRLNGPIQNIVEDARRHSALSNLPGTDLPYTLIRRDLSAPLLQLSVELNGSAEFRDPASGQKLFEKIVGLTEKGENLSQELGIPVSWNMKVGLESGKMTVSLHVLGEHVNDTYIDEVIEIFADKGFRLLEQSREGQEYILFFGS